MNTQSLFSSDIEVRRSPSRKARPSGSLIVAALGTPYYVWGAGEEAAGGRGTRGTPGCAQER
ncbi:hypothetical protein [Archangium sp.]|uniref:hypothetical protein n=1 Tax=Archangium sp. TaxID=1872627 RepID=UPI002D47D8A1|nr:hypothetical protein [Archangium sp.]HYO60152.1 hypothetical protein [Archangium sp.]